MAKGRNKKEHSLDDDFDWTATRNGKFSDESLVVDSFFRPAEITAPITTTTPVATKITTSEQVEPKLSQTEAKVRPIVEPKLSQTEAKVRPNDLSANLNFNETEAKVEPQLRPLHKPKLSQSAAKVEPTGSVSELVGLQRNLLYSIYNSCRFAGSKTSAPLSIQFLVETSRSTASAVRKAIQRLEEKGFIQRALYKDGRGGWTKYLLPNEIYSALLQTETEAKVEPKLSQTAAKVEPQLRPQLRPSIPSSSSFLELENFKTTTTTGEPELLENIPSQLAPEWQTLDVSPLVEIGFSQTHLIQIIHQGKLQPPEVQDSIQFFAFDLKRNGKGNTLNGPPLNFFMGILRKGIPYAPPENYESPADEARRKTCEFKERKERERQAEEQKILDLEFSEWRRGLPDADLVALLPEFARKPGPMQDSALKTHFANEVWPTRAPELLGLAKLDHVEIGRQIDKALTEVQL